MLAEFPDLLHLKNSLQMEAGSPEAQQRVLEGFEDNLEAFQKKINDQLQVVIPMSSRSHQQYAYHPTTDYSWFVWKIPEVSRRKKDAIWGDVKSIYSPPFYTGRNGYKVCIQAYLYGDGTGYLTHLSLFFVLMKGEFDHLLRWPFDRRVKLILVDQSFHEHIIRFIEPTQDISFQRPISDMNIASGCPQFVKLGVLDKGNYVRDDAMYIVCSVGTPIPP